MHTEGYVKSPEYTMQSRQRLQGLDQKTRMTDIKDGEGRSLLPPSFSLSLTDFLVALH